jgi:hypothetical protein
MQKIVIFARIYNGPGQRQFKTIQRRKVKGNLTAWAPYRTHYAKSSPTTKPPGCDRRCGHLPQNAKMREVKRVASL